MGQRRNHKDNQKVFELIDNKTNLYANLWNSGKKTGFRRKFH